MSEKQKTLAQKITLTGKGLHTGLEVSLTINPAKEGSGICFKRVDLEEQPIIPALATYVIDTSRGTVLEKDGARIGTIEHCLAALFGCDIDNALIELDSSEAPILDGSAKLYVKAIKEAGVVEQTAEREYFEVTEKISYKDEDKGVELIVLPDSEFSINAMIAYGDSSVLNNQYAVLNGMDDFAKEIAPCRTFVFLRELEVLLNHNLVKGGDLDNAIVIMDRKVSQEELDRIADLFNHEYIAVKEEQGILNNLDLLFDNEPARHKILDIIGDLALVGKRIKGRVIATRPGHHVNTQLAKNILKQINKDSAPKYDPNLPSIFDVNKIMTLLPHRSPFLLVDKIIDIQENTIVGVKNVTMNEPFFVGHFPSEPVMPGVLMVEAMAQTGGLLILNGLKDSGYSTYFMKIDNIKFRKKVVPGDTLIFKLELLSPIRRGVANMRGHAYVGKSLVAEGEFMAQVVKNK